MTREEFRYQLSGLSKRELVDVLYNAYNKLEALETKCDNLLEFVKRNTPTINGETTMECVERSIKEYFEKSPEGCPGSCDGCTDDWEDK